MFGVRAARAVSPAHAGMEGNAVYEPAQCVGFPRMRGEGSFITWAVGTQCRLPPAHAGMEGV